MQIGYARVSTSEQETSLQLDALRRAGVRKIFQEKTSSVGARPELQRAMRSMRSGDVLVVWKLDRLARSLGDLLRILEQLGQAGSSFRSLTEPVDTSSPMGVFMLQVLGAVAQLERSMIRERAIAGQVAAYERGVRWGGRPKALTKKQRLEALRLSERGWTQLRIADRLGVSRSTVSRILNPPPKRERQALPVLREYLKVCAG
jgi:DNA invertase Pin-like site-specific DNA recombinase